MKTLEALGHHFYVGPMQKKLACRGSSNSETVCFKLDRYSGKTDLSECHCTIKTKNSEGKSDLAVPEVTADDKKIYITWQPSSGATTTAGPLLVQLQLEKTGDDSGRKFKWQSNVMEFMIPDSLDAADEIADREPTLFQQWEKKVGKLYSDAAADVQSVQALQTQVRTDAVAQQKQSVEQTAAQASQCVPDSAGSAKDAADSAEVAQNSATQDRQLLDDSQKAVAIIQQTVNSFSGYTRPETNDRFANTLIGEKSGQTISICDVQPDSDFRYLLVSGQTVQDGSGDPSPDNVRAIHGTASLTVSDGGSNTQTIRLPQTLYSLPDGTADSFDTVNGTGTQKLQLKLLDGSESWSFVSYTYDENSKTVWFPMRSDDVQMRYSGAVFSHFQAVNTVSGVGDVECGATISTAGISGINIKVLKTRLAGWSENWTETQKSAAFQAWMRQNPVTVLYELSQPKSFSAAVEKSAAFTLACLVTAGGAALVVRYNRDCNLAIQNLESRIASLS